jgi:hypothetical protein
LSDATPSLFGRSDLNAKLAAPTAILVLIASVEKQCSDSLEQVIALVFQVWESLEQSLIDSVIDSMSSRLQAIVEANGGTYTVLTNRGNQHLNPTKFGKTDAKKWSNLQK